MEIGILEYHYHRAFVETLKKICANHNVIVFNNVKQAKRESDNLDLLFINTIQPVPWDIVRWIAFKPKCKTIWTLHELNTDFKFSKILLKKFDAINVPYLPMKDYILENNLYNGKMFTLPFMLHEKSCPNTNKMFVVPGRIQKFRRDYDIVFRMMNKSQYWCFLGAPIGIYGDRIFFKCTSLNDNGYHIEYFPDFVPKEKYDNILKGCKAIVAPLRNPTLGTNMLCKEIYGKTKACGAIFEAIRFGKAFISNMNIQINYKDYLLNDLQKYFENEVLEEIM